MVSAPSATEVSQPRRHRALNSEPKALILPCQPTTRLVGCLYKLRLLVVGVLVIRALFGMYTWAGKFWKLPFGFMRAHRFTTLLFGACFGAVFVGGLVEEPMNMHRLLKTGPCLPPEHLQGSMRNGEFFRTSNLCCTASARPSCPKKTGSTCPFSMRSTGGVLKEGNHGNGRWNLACIWLLTGILPKPELRFLNRP